MANRPLSDEQRRALWAKHQPATTRAAGPQRRPPRVAYDRATIAVRITHPGGGCRTAAVYAHDLSSGGLSFLYPGFLHAGTAVSAALRRRAGGEAVAHGSVVWCRHVGGLWHGIGVRFATALVPAAFVDPAGDDAVTAETVTPRGDSPLEIKPDPTGRGGLTGRVLVLEDQELDQALFLHTVRNTRLAVTTVDDAAAAVSTAAAGEFDVVCVDLNLGPGQPTGERAMAELRAAGYAGPFIIVSDDGRQRLERARAADEGGTAQAVVVAKPYTATQLLAALSAALAPVAAALEPAAEVEPLHSDLAGQDGMAPLLRGFRSRAQSAAAELDRLLATPSTLAGVTDGRGVVAARQVCQMLRGAGRGYGYPTVSAAAETALAALEEGGGLTSATAPLRAVSALCRRLAG